jgi:outer membrane lipoprotein-sorting protein
MNCLKKIALITAVLASFASISSALDLDAIAENFSKTQTIETSWTMETVMPAASRPILSSGKFYFKRSFGFKWEQTKPDLNGLLFANEEILAYKSIDKDDIEIEDVSDKKFAKDISALIYSFASMDIKILKKTYRIESAENGIVFYPKNARRNPFEKIELYFAKDAAVFEKISLFNKNGSTVVITFMSVKIDEYIDEDTFSI